MQETWVRSLGQEDPLEKETATHSSILAWRIPWIEEPGLAAVHRTAKSWTLLQQLNMHFWGVGACLSPGFYLIEMYNRFFKKMLHKNIWTQNTDPDHQSQTRPG